MHKQFFFEKQTRRYLAFSVLCILVIFCGVPLQKWRSAREKADLTNVVSKSIKNAQGKPANLWWWQPKREPAALIMVPGDGEGESIWASGWMVDKWLKVAEIKSLSANKVKVFLLSEPPSEVREYRYFVALRQDLSKTRH